MVTTSKEMLGSVEKRVDKLRGELETTKEEQKNLTNQLKIEDMVFIELDEKKDDLAQEQKYIVIALKDEIALQGNKISELEIEIKLLCKKHEILKRDWDF